MIRRAAFLILLLGSVLGAQVDSPRPQSGLVVEIEDATYRILGNSDRPGARLSPTQSLHPQIGLDFRATWTGLLRIPHTGAYTLQAEARIWVDGQELVPTKPVWWTAGDHPLRVELRRKGETSIHVQLVWGVRPLSGRTGTCVGLRPSRTARGLRNSRGDRTRARPRREA